MDSNECQPKALFDPRPPRPNRARSTLILFFGIVAACYWPVFAWIPASLAFGAISRIDHHYARARVEYAPEFTEEAFESIEPGIPESEVRNLLGPPLEETPGDPAIRWLYVDGSPGDYATAGTRPESGPFSELIFSAEGKFEGCSGFAYNPVEGYWYTFSPHANLLGISNSKLERWSIEGTTMSEMEAAYGAPSAEYADLAVRWLEYAQSPNVSLTFQRRVGIDRQGRACGLRSNEEWDMWASWD